MIIREYKHFYIANSMFGPFAQKRENMSNGNKKSVNRLYSVILKIVRIGAILIEEVRLYCIYMV